jgi:hypothetical protein
MYRYMYIGCATEHQLEEASCQHLQYCTQNVARNYVPRPSALGQTEDILVLGLAAPMPY